MPVDFQALKAELGKIPWWGYGLAGGVVFAGYFYLKGHSAKSTSGISANNAASANLPAGLNAADLAGMPFDYTDFQAATPSDTSTTGTTTTGTDTSTTAAQSAAAAQTAVPDSDAGTDTSGAPGSTVGTPTPSPAPQPAGAAIRSRQSDPANGFYGYDSGHPQGVPLWTQPGGSTQMGYAPYGEPVSIVGPAVNGSYKLASGGYVHVQDVANAATGGGFGHGWGWGEGGGMCWPGWEEIGEGAHKLFGLSWRHLENYNDGDAMSSIGGAAFDNQS